MPGVSIARPRTNGLLAADQDFTVSGIAFDRGWPEPTMIDEVVVRVDNGPVVQAVLSPGQPSSQTVFDFVATVHASATQGEHTVSVTATNDMGRSATKSITVFVGVGPLHSAFTGTSTLKTTHPRDEGAHVSMLSAFLEFSADRRTTALALAPIRDVSSPQAGVTVTIDVNLVGGGVGLFDQATGSFAVPVALGFRVLVAVAGITLSDTRSTLAVTLTTGAQTSPTGAFSDTGAPMDGTGMVVLVGDGQFSGGALNGHDASLVIVGTVAPRP